MSFFKTLSETYHLYYDTELNSLNFTHVEPNGVVDDRRRRDVVAPLAGTVRGDVSHTVMVIEPVSVVLPIKDTSHTTCALALHRLTLNHASVVRDAIFDFEVRDGLGGRERHVIGLRVSEELAALVNVGIGSEGHDLLHRVGLGEGVFTDAYFALSALYDSEDVRSRGVPLGRLALRCLCITWLRCFAGVTPTFAEGSRAKPMHIFGV